MTKLEVINTIKKNKALLEKAASAISGLRDELDRYKLLEHAEKVAMLMVDKGLIDMSEFLTKRAELMENASELDKIEAAVGLAKQGASFYIGTPDDKQESIRESDRIRENILSKVL